MAGRPPRGWSVVTAALVVLAATSLAACWVLVPVLVGQREIIAGTLLVPFALGAGLIWLAWALAGRRTTRARAHDHRRRWAVLHLVTGVLITAGWLLTTVFLYVVAELDVWKTERVSLGPLFAVAGFLGLTGSLDLLHRTLAPEAPRRVSLAMALLTVAGSYAALLLAADLVSGPDGSPSRFEAVLAQITAFGLPPLLAVLGVVVVRARAGRATPSRSDPTPSWRSADTGGDLSR